MNAYDTASQIITASILSAKYPAFLEKMGKLNSKMNRHGLAPYTWTEEYREDHSKDQTGVAVGYVDVEISSPKISYGGWTFAASMKAEDMGYIVRTAPGIDLDGIFTTPEIGTADCEHCNIKRANRKRFYVLLHETEGVKVVGSSCIKAFLGMDISGLWWLETELEPEIREYTTGDLRGSLRAHLDTVIAMALIHTEMGMSYVPSRSEDRVSTSSLVGTTLWGTHLIRDAAERRFFLDKGAESIALLEDRPELIASVRASVDGMEAGSTYADNMKVLFASDYINASSLGFAVSAVAVWARENVKRAEAAAWRKGFINEIGEKIANETAEVTSIRFYDNQWGGFYWVNLRIDGYMARWKTADVKELEEGSKFVIGSARVKDHAEYNGTDQTIVKGIRIKSILD